MARAGAVAASEAANTSARKAARPHADPDDSARAAFDRTGAWIVSLLMWILAAESSARRGAASTGLAWVVALLVVLIGLAAWYARDSAPSEPPMPLPAHPATHAPDGGSAIAPVGNAVSRDAPAPPAVPADPRATAHDPARFDGRGRIRGELSAAPGVTLPARWKLCLDPHPTWIGSERAVRRVIECANAEFTVPDVPLAAYRVRAEAEGLNGDSVDVLLVRGSDDVFVQIALHPAGRIDGRVLAPDGAPAEDLLVTLEAHATNTRRETRVAADGTFEFRDVVDGEYALTYGPPESPLVPPREILFRAPTLRAPAIDMPPTASIRVRTVDARGQAVPSVEVDGFGAPRGFVRTTTGFDGKALARWLPAGLYRLEARAPDGRRGKISVDVNVGPEVEVVLQLR